MMNRLQRLFVAVIIAAGVVALPNTPAQADPSSCAGVLVVVDATYAGGAVTVRCAEGIPQTGLDALTAVGFDYTFVPRIPGMVCQIDNRPNPCNNAPATAYWSYWQRDGQGPWRYATEGAGTSRPAAGSTEGWVFGAGDQPPDVAFTQTSDQTPTTTSPNQTPASAPPTDSSAATQEPPSVNHAVPSDDPPDTENRDASVSAAVTSQTDTQTDTQRNTTDEAPASSRFFDRFVEEPRQLVGLLLLVIGVVALITAQRNRPKQPPQ